MLAVALIAISVLVQIAAAWMALRLIPITGKRRAWVLISIALLFMAVRRGITLLRLVEGVVPQPPDLSAEWVTLLISCLMFAGIAWIAPLFHSITRMAEELRESEVKYRTLFEQSKDAIYIRSREGLFEDANQATLDLFGYDKGELIGMELERIYIRPEDRLEFQRAIERQGSVKDYELRFRRKDGTEIDCLVTSTVERDHAGNVKGYRGIIRDITESKRASELLRRERERFFALLNELPAFVDLHARDRTLVFANRRFREEFGSPDQKESCEAVTESLVPVASMEVPPTFSRCSSFATECTSPTGKTYQVHHFPFEDVDECQVVLEFGIDITDLRDAERALRESEAKYRELVEHANSIILKLDTDGRITFLNEFAQTFFGYPAAEILGKHVLDTIVPATDRAGRDLTAFIADVLEHPEWHRSEENENMRKDGERVVVSWANRAIVDKDGNPLGLLCIGNDVTRLRTLEEQYRQSQKLETVGQLAGGIAHDLNNLLGVISGYADLTLMAIGQEMPQRSKIEAIRDASERAASLTRQLLAFSRKQILEPVVLNLNGVTEQIEQMLRRLIGEDIDLVTMLASDLASVKVDPGQIEQVIMNLAVNARDAMPHGGKLTIETANVDLDEEYANSHVAVTPGRHVMLAVSDTGTGMTNDVLSHIFEPFFTTKGQGKGTGLGLATVYGIVRQSGGNIWVYSEPGRGTTFKIYFPWHQTGSEDQTARASETELDTLPGGSETILLVEDEGMFRSMVKLTLEKAGYTVLDAADGEVAIKVSAEHSGPIHLLLTDVVMPGMSGRQIAERLKELRPDMEVVYMSGYTDNAIVHHGVLDSGMAFLQKPFTPEKLTRKIRKVLDKAP